MPRIDNEKFYTSAIKMHGTTAKGVNWNSKESQSIRFEMILELLPKELDSLSIADAGCGFGDFYLYLQKKRKLPKKYIGIDSLADMYSIASEQTGCEILIADVCKDSLPLEEYYICSGAMNTLQPFETYQFIQNCFNSSKTAFIFNILHGDKESQTYNYLTTLQIKTIAKELGVKKLIFKENYLKNDITVGFFK